MDLDTSCTASDKRTWICFGGRQHTTYTEEEFVSELNEHNMLEEVPELAAKFKQDNEKSHQSEAYFEDIKPTYKKIDQFAEKTFSLKHNENFQDVVQKSRNWDEILEPLKHESVMTSQSKNLQAPTKANIKAPIKASIKREKGDWIAYSPK